MWIVAGYPPLDFKGHVVFCTTAPRRVGIKHQHPFVGSSSSHMKHIYIYMNIHSFFGATRQKNTSYFRHIYIYISPSQWKFEDPLATTQCPQKIADWFMARDDHHPWEKHHGKSDVPGTGPWPEPTARRGRTRDVRHAPGVASLQGKPKRRRWFLGDFYGRTKMIISLQFSNVFMGGCRLYIYTSIDFVWGIRAMLLTIAHPPKGNGWFHKQQWAFHMNVRSFLQPIW